MWRLQLGFSVCSLWVCYLGISVGAQTSLMLGLNVLEPRGFAVLFLRPAAGFLHCQHH